MRHECLYAHTEPSGPGYPAFLNVSRWDDGNYHILVRSRNEFAASEIVLTPEQFAALKAAL